MSLQKSLPPYFQNELLLSHVAVGAVMGKNMVMWGKREGKREGERISVSLDFFPFQQVKNIGRNSNLLGCLPDRYTDPI